MWKCFVWKLITQSQSLTKLPYGKRTLIICYCAPVFQQLSLILSCPYIPHTFYTFVCLSVSLHVLPQAMHISVGVIACCLPASSSSSSSVFFFLVCWSVGWLFKTSSFLLLLSFVDLFSCCCTRKDKE